MAPLVRVTAEIYCSEAGKTPDWTGVRVYPVGEEGPHQCITSCASLRGKASFLLPPGLHDFAVRGSGPDVRLPAPLGQAGLRVKVSADQTVLDLGVIDVALPRDKDDIARDYSQYYGAAPPEMAIADARGVAKDLKLAEFRGKWVLLEFWAVWCGPCVGSRLPDLARFYEEHAADRDRFEVLAICNRSIEKVRTIEAFEGLIAPIVENRWAGKQLPFRY